MSVSYKQEAACHSQSVNLWMSGVSSGTKSCNGAVELKVIVDIVFSFAVVD